jgi:hypothetical protein
LVNTLIIKSLHISLAVSLGSVPERTAGSKGVRAFKASDAYCQIIPVNGRTCSPGPWPTQLQSNNKGFRRREGIGLLPFMFLCLQVRYYFYFFIDHLCFFFVAILCLFKSVFALFFWFAGREREKHLEDTVLYSVPSLWTQKGSNKKVTYI